MARETRRLRQLDRPGSASGVEAWLARARLTVSGGVVLAVAVLGWLGARALGSKTMYLLVYAGVLTMAGSWLTARRRLAIDVDNERTHRVAEEILARETETVA